MRVGSNDSYTRDLVLIGGGHSHSLLLLRWAMAPVPDVRVTMISEASTSPYSGMLPGLVAGHYSERDVHVDLRRLCSQAGVRFLRARACGLDPAARRIQLEDRPPVDYDTLSINVGGAPELSVPGAAAFAVPIKPVASFHRRWLAVRQQLLEDTAPRQIAVVGGGAASVELAFSIGHALRDAPVHHRIRLVTGCAEILPHYPRQMREWTVNRLVAAGIGIDCGFNVARIRRRELESDGGMRFAADYLFWVTESVAPRWLRDTALPVTENGFLRVSESLQCIAYPEVFATGDCAWIEGRSLPRAGVYAVRQAAALHDNLSRYLSGRPLRPYKPQRHFLSLLACGGRDAVGSRGRLSIAGSWVWRWKDRIDRRFMARFHDLPVMPPPRQDAERSLEPAAMRCAGCGAKVGADLLRQALADTGEERDDAALIDWPQANGRSSSHVLVQSVDALKPLVDDPYLFGRITTLHALSDLFAMHATPDSAQAVLQLPVMAEALQLRDARQVLHGVTFELGNHGARLVGGHTMEGDALQLALTVNGFAEPATVLHKSGLRPGDALIQTKALGTGTLFSAAMRGAAEAAWIDEAVRSMLATNQAAADIFWKHGAHALTDVTGFGLVGHLLEMLQLSNWWARLDIEAIPALPGALLCLRRGYSSTLAPANRRTHRLIKLNEVEADDARYQLLFDPQTAGGLLAAVPSDRVQPCLQALAEAGVAAARIGAVFAGSGASMIEVGRFNESNADCPASAAEAP